MRRNKRRKQRLKSALVLLIVLFILAGLGGMLFISHKNKVEKQQRKEAALAALESIPEVTATPVATLTPVPTILPAFEPENYQGIWYSEDGLTTINIYDISLKSVSFTYKRINGRNHSLSAEADVTAEVAGNATQFRFKDSEGNKAKGEFVFDKSGELYVKVKTYKRADGSKTYPKTESIMRREAPVEEDSSQEQTADNNAAEGSSETSEEGTVSYDENTYSEDTYYNGSNDTSSQEDADIYQIPYGEEETYYTE